MRNSALWLVLLLALPLGGCNILAYFLYLISPPEPMKTVEAGFDGLPKRSVVVVIYAGDKVLHDYPRSSLDLALAIGDELKNEEKIKDVTVIPPERVDAYQNKNMYWGEEDKTQLGRRFGADFVLLISVIEYSMHQRGSINVSRGRIVAEASLYETARPEHSARVWRTPDVRAVLDNAPSGRPFEDTQLAYNTRRIFAEKLVKNFYEHKVPANPEERMR